MAIPARAKVLLGIAVLFLSLPLHAGVCVKITIRTGNDGYKCMKFSQEQRQVAASYGLHLGASFASVKQVLTRRGWVVDHAWLQRTFDHPESDMGCGNGYDAICSTVYTKNRKHIYLQLSGTNDGFPLIDVSAMSLERLRLGL